MAFAAVPLALATLPLDTAHAQSLPTLMVPSAPGTHAFNASSFQRVPFDLSSVGYSEQEYFISGLANAYQYTKPGSATDETVATLAGGPVPYVNRILVRMPTSPAKFSGNVIVEVINSALIADNPSIWPDARNRFVANGDAWVGITATPTAVASLKSYSGTRYAALSWPALASTASCAGGTAEAGIIYDEITQLGRLLKSGPNLNNPLAGYNVTATYLSGYSQAASILLTYDLVFGRNAPLFDAYFIASGGYRAALNSCEQSSVSTGRPFGPTSTVSPVMQTQTLSEEELAIFGLPSNTDSDAANNRYRFYDIAGTSHVDATLYNAQPQPSDIQAARGTTFVQSDLQQYCNDPAASLLSTFPDHYAYDAIWASLEGWVKSGTLPPHTAKLQTAGYSGYPIGGWRTPAVDVPGLTYYGGSAAPANYPMSVRVLCALTGYQLPLSSATSSGLYPTQTAYRRKVSASAKGLAANGFLTPEDANALIANPSAP